MNEVSKNKKVKDKDMEKVLLDIEVKLAKCEDLIKLLPANNRTGKMLELLQRAGGYANDMLWNRDFPRIRDVISHSYGVAELMYMYSSNNNEEMYVLGLVHDIGKLMDFKNHAVVGGDFLHGMGFPYWREVYWHGQMTEEYASFELDLLNYADMSVNLYGSVVGFDERLSDIASRYGKESLEYANAVCMVEHLKSRGFLDFYEE